MKLVCKFDDEDFNVDKALEMNFNDNKQFSHSFWKEVKALPDFYSKEGIDILYLSLGVFAADRLFKRVDAYDAWSRDIELYIPVLAFDKWETLKIEIEEMLNFLSGDSWKVYFRKRTYTKREEIYKEKYEKLKTKKQNYSTLCMLSGGLDSCIGAIDVLESSSDISNVLFISHYGGGKGTVEYQNALKEKIVASYDISDTQFFRNHATVKHALENTTRARSFMFFSHAIAYASAMEGEVEIIVPENGLISLNVPLGHTRLGTSSTRTTHPHYMEMLRDLIHKLGMKITISNPYQFKTKGEMINECKNLKLLQTVLGSTMSCSHPDVGRFRGVKKSMHCGYCFPCTIRKAAILRGGLNDTSEYFDKNYNSLTIAKENMLTYMYAIKNHKPEMSFLKIQNSGPIKNHTNQYADLYNRGIQELKKYLENINA